VTFLKIKGTKNIALKNKNAISKRWNTKSIGYNKHRKKDKIKAMQRTWNFTKIFPLLIRNIEAFFYIMIS
jgi:hypothetical protein